MNNGRARGADPMIPSPGCGWGSVMRAVGCGNGTAVAVSPLQPPSPPSPPRCGENNTGGNNGDLRMDGREGTSHIATGRSVRPSETATSASTPTAPEEAAATAVVAAAATSAAS
ncbi:hypothetical protein Vretifemale_4931, partial [Volvox reticuliferus]